MGKRLAEEVKSYIKINCYKDLAKYIYIVLFTISNLLK